MKKDFQATTIYLVSVLFIIGFFGATSFAGSQKQPTGKPIVIGLPINLSGPVGVADHKDHLNGTNLAVKQINAAGGVLGRPLEIKIVDQDILTPEGTIAGFQALADAKVHAISSPFVLIPTPALDAASAYKAPYLNGNTSEAALTIYRSNPEKFSNVFQADPSEIWYGSGFISFLDRLRTSGKWSPKNNKIHIVQGQIAYTQLISKKTQEAIAKSEYWKQGIITDVQSPTNDWSSVIREIKRGDAGVIMIDHWVAAELASFAQQFSENPAMDTLVYLQYGPSQPEFLDIAGPAAEGFVWSTVLGVLNHAAGEKFKKDYQKEFPGTMGRAYNGMAYDIVHILANAWKAVGDPNDFAKVNAYIRKNLYRGVNGSYDFNNSNQAPPPYPAVAKNPDKGLPHQYLQIQGGEHKTISPSMYAESEFVLPPWSK